MLKSSSTRSRGAVAAALLPLLQGCRGYGGGPFTGGPGDAEAFLFMIGLALVVFGVVASARN